MKGLFASCLLVSLFSAILPAQEIAIVSSCILPPYQKAIEGLQEELEALEYSVHSLGSEKENRRLRQHLRTTNISCFITVGGAATKFVLSIRQAQLVISCLTIYEPKEDEKKTIVVPYLPPSQAVTKSYRQFYPKKKERIGTLWCNKALASIVKSYERTFAKGSCSLKACRVNSPREIPRGLKDLTGEIDAFFLLPDPVLLHKETLRHLLLTLLQKSIPVIAFSPSLVKAGALFSLSYCPKGIGKKAGIIARRELLGEDTPLPKVELIFKCNSRVAKFLGVSHP